MYLTEKRRAATGVSHVTDCVVAHAFLAGLGLQAEGLLA